MHKMLLLSFLLFAATCLKAQESYTVHVDEPGTLYTKLQEAGIPFMVSHIKITGNIDSRDFGFIYATSFDLSDANIVEYHFVEVGGGNGEFTYPANELPTFAFWYNSLKDILLPSSITSIGHCSLTNCFDLTQITIPNKVQSIGYAAFAHCTGLKQIAFPSSVKTIMDSAFMECTGLSEINIPSTVEHIGSQAFCLCKAPIFVDEANANYSSWNGMLFDKNQTTLYYCPTSKNGPLELPGTVETIGEWSFLMCSSITQITIPVTTNTIKDYAFWDCNGLEKIEILGSPSSIGEFAFAECDGLRSFKLNAPTPPSIMPYTFNNTDITKCTLYVPVGAKTAYQNTDIWKDFGHIIEGEGFWTSADNQTISLDNSETAVIAINSNTTCSISSNAAWLTSNVSTVTGNGEITLTAQPNDSPNARTATVTIATASKGIQPAAIYASPQMQKSGILKSSISLSNYLTITITQAGNIATGAHDKATNGFSIFPNPASDGFTVFTGSGPALLTIEEMNGSTVLRQTVTDKDYVSIGHLKSGVYTVTVNGKSTKLVKR